MRCPYCDKEMIKKYKIKHFCNFDDPCDSWEKEIHICKKCGIKKVDGKWKIPHKYRRPSTNQIHRCKTLAKIYDIDFEPLLARQCKRFTLTRRILTRKGLKSGSKRNVREQRKENLRNHIMLR